MKVTSRLMASLVLALVAASAGRTDDRTESLPPELSWVPRNCTAFVHVRFAELWDSHVGRAIRDAFARTDPTALAKFEQSLGLRLAQIDRVTILIPDLLDERGEPGIVARITTTEPYDAQKVITSVAERDNDRSPAQQRLFKLKESRGMLHLSGPRDLTFVFSEKGAIGLLSRMLENDSSGGLDPALRAAAGKNQLVAAVDLSHLQHLKGDNIPPAFVPLLDGKLALVRGNLTADSADFDLRVAFTRPGLAEDGAKALEAIRGELLSGLQRASAELARDKETTGRAQLLETVTAALKAATISVDDRHVAGRLTLKTGQPLQILAREGIAALRLSSARTESQNNLKQLGLAMHNYHDTHGTLPPAAIIDKNGKPMLSWRVLILPYIEQDNLFKQFHLDEPWDSEHNKKLIQFMPKTYALPGDKAKHQLPSTYYRVFVGNDAMFEWKRSTRFAQISDGLSNTIMVVEAADAVPWTKPDEIDYDPNKAPLLGFHFGERANVLMGDGSVRAVRKTIAVNTLHLMIQRSDGMPIPFDD